MNNHKELMNNVIHEMMAKKKPDTSNNVMSIRLKMSEKPIEIPLEMIDWDTLSNASNMENLKRNLDSLWEFTYSLLMIPKSDVIKVYDDTCNEIITEVKNFIYENFSITLQYDEIIAKTQLCTADIALLYCDDAKEILNAFINGCENYLIGERIAMLQDALHDNGKTTQIEIPKEDTMDNFDMSSFDDVPKMSMNIDELKDTTLAQHVLQKRMNSIPDGFMNPNIKMDEAIMKIHEFIKTILTQEELNYANTNPLVAEDETIHAINQKLLQNGFGDFLKDLLVKKPEVVVTNTAENVGESIIDKKIDLDEFQDSIMNTPELEVIMNDIAKREENHQ
jgi:hypothetical protein